jgi:hypothetical protein
VRRISKQQIKIAVNPLHSTQPHFVKNRETIMRIKHKEDTEISGIILLFIHKANEIAANVLPLRFCFYTV